MPVKDISGLHQTLGGDKLVKAVAGAARPVAITQEPPPPDLLDILRGGAVTTGDLHRIEVPKHPLILGDWSPPKAIPHRC